MFAWEKVANFTMKKVSLLKKFCIKIQENNLQRNQTVQFFFQNTVCPKIKKMFI